MAGVQIRNKDIILDPTSPPSNLERCERFPRSAIWASSTSSRSPWTEPRIQIRVHEKVHLTRKRCAIISIAHTWLPVLVRLLPLGVLRRDGLRMGTEPETCSMQGVVSGHHNLSRRHCAACSLGCLWDTHTPGRHCSHCAIREMLEPRRCAHCAMREMLETGYFPVQAHTPGRRTQRIAMTFGRWLLCQ